jgi:mono/diheme cytochrome c family protein
MTTRFDSFPLKGESGTMRHVSAVLLVVCVCVCASVVTTAQNPGGSPEGKKLKNPVAATPDSITAGQQTFQKMCSFCHGKDATGNGSRAPKTMTPPPNLTDAAWDRGASDGEIFLVMQHGAGPKFEMKGLKGKVPDQDLWNVVNYIRSLNTTK